jgi:two-component system cell cycle response regulator
MTARILIVDDLLPNVKLLEAKLSREYYEVLTAMSGKEALEIASRDDPDLILLDVMMPEMDGFEVCRRLKADEHTAHIPVVMVTALSDTADRVQGLEAGAHDFLTKPINDVSLLTRVSSLLRVKMMLDELRLREQTGLGLGIVSTPNEDSAAGGHILVVEDRSIYANNIEKALSEHHTVIVNDDAAEAYEEARRGGIDLVVVSLSLREADGLRLCSQLRSLEETRLVPLLTIADDTPEDQDRMMKGLEIGVNDYLIRPVDANELRARCRTQVRRKRYQERLRINYERSMALAVTDSLTGIYNRNYLEAHLENVVQRSVLAGKPVSMLLLDLDHFKTVNDTHGHAAGDDVLREFSGCIQRVIRSVDLAARFGGEEFVVLMPETTAESAAGVAERLRRATEEMTLPVAGSDEVIKVTTSIGVYASQGSNDTGAEMIRRADEALYAAKHAGRNQVMIWEDKTDKLKAQAV